MFFLFDIGGTNIRLALINDLNAELDINQVQKIPTPINFKDGLTSIKNFLEQNDAIGKIEKTIGGTTGVLDHGRTKIIRSINLKGWENKHLKQEISLLTQSPTEIYNDSALASLGEAAYGIGKDYSIVTYITVSTGVGGARIVNKRIEESSLNYEPGHQIINVEGGIKYLEDLVSGTGIYKKFGKKAEEINDPKIYEEIEHYLAIGLNNIIVHWAPEILIIGGAVGKNLNIDNIKSNLKNVMRIYPELPVIQQSNLRHNVIQGALYLLRQ